jgi:hypothetical protein
MMTAILIRTGLAAALMFFATPPAFSQLVDFLTSPGYSALIHNEMNRAILRGAAKSSGRTSGDRTSTAARPDASSQSSRAEVPAYRRYPAVQFKSTGTRLTLQEYLASVRIGPKEKEELKLKILVIFELYEQEASKKGYPNDLALALVSTIGLNSHVYQGRTEKLLLSFEQNIGQRDMIAEYAADNGTFSRLNDRQKQELYELFILLGALTYHYYDNAVKANDAAEIKNIREVARDNLKLLGLAP